MRFGAMALRPPHVFWFLCANRDVDSLTDARAGAEAGTAEAVAAAQPSRRTPQLLGETAPRPPTTRPAVRGAPA